MSTILLIDGKQFDEQGHELDRFGRRILQKLPEVVAKIAKMKAEALERARAPKVFDSPEDKQAYLDTELLRKRLDSLREDVFHLQCHKKFLEEVSDLNRFESLVDELDFQMRKLKAYRDHLVEMRSNAPKLLSENHENVLRKERDIDETMTKLEDAELRLTRRTRTAKASEPKSAAYKKAEAFMKQMHPSVVEQYLKQNNCSKEQAIELLAKTMGGMK